MREVGLRHNRNVASTMVRLTLVYRLEYSVLVTLTLDSFYSSELDQLIILFRILYQKYSYSSCRSNIQRP